MIALFCGGGSGCKGLTMLGRTVDVAIDIDPVALSVLEHNRLANKTEAMDLRNIANLKKCIKANGIKRIRHIIASPPCQEFSLAAYRQRPISGGKSLMIVTAEHISALKPPTFTLENVMPLYSSPVYEKFKEIVCKYYDLVEMTLDPCRLPDGSPTMRKRAYIVGFLKRGTQQEIKDVLLPIDERIRGGVKMEPWALQEILPHIKEYVWHTKRNKHGKSMIPKNEPYPTMRTNCTSIPPVNHVKAEHDPVDISEVSVLSAEELALVQGYGEEFSFPEHMSRTKKGKIIGESQSPACQKLASNLAFELEDLTKLMASNINRDSIVYRIGNCRGSGTHTSRIDPFMQFEDEPGVTLVGGKDSVRKLWFDVDALSPALRAIVMNVVGPFHENPKGIGWRVMIQDRGVQNTAADDIYYFHKETNRMCRSHPERRKLLDELQV